MKAALKYLIFTTLGISLAALFLPILYSWLALSHTGIKRLYLWQLISYVLIEKGPISLGFFLQLGFNMYILWMFGSSLIERLGIKAFFSLYFGSALISGLTVLFFPGAFLAGSINAVYAVLIAWILLNPGSQLLLFFAIPFKAEWLILCLIGFSLIINLTNAQWLEAITLVTSCLYGYLFALLVWRQYSPFLFLRSFEKKVLRLFEKRKNDSFPSSKIYDIKTGSPILDDEQFMDAMLDRISRHGEDSLTAAEKKRMKEISARKK
jgi:membrane associated rhomboid family serine protease